MKLSDNVLLAEQSAKFLWRIVAVDQIANPQRVRNITVKGPMTARGAIDSAIHSDSFENFKADFPLCGIAKVEFIGILDA